MNVTYKNDLNKALLILEEEEKPEVDYQTFMLQENVIAGLLKTDIRYLNGKSCYQYDISGKRSLQSKYEQEKLSCQELSELVRAILAAVSEVKRYMLDGGNLILEPEYIFCDGERYYFTYYPPYESIMTEKFHELTEFFVREVDYRDKKGVHLAYALHRGSMEENYSIENIMEAVFEEEAAAAIQYERKMEAAMQEQKEVESEVAEEKSFRNFVRKWWERKKQEKWGSW